MRKFAVLLLVTVMVIFTSCGNNIQSAITIETAEDAKAALVQGNSEYVAGVSSADISNQKREDTAANGQSPYAVIVTCSDSRVPAEHIFNAGIGELFVIRTAGNVIGDYELGSVEYGAEHLGVKLVVVLGHTQCGAVEAALAGDAHGYIKAITDEVASCLPQGCDPRQAEILNVQNSIAKIKSSEIMTELATDGEVVIVGAIYNIADGTVDFLDDEAIAE